MAAVWFKHYMQKRMGGLFRYYRLIYNGIAAASLAALVVYQFSRTGTLLFTRSLPLTVLATVIAVTGIGVMAACIKKYFLNMSGIDVLLKDKRPPVLEVSGLHRYVRHPLYSGTLLFIWSLFLFFPYLHHLIACIIITVYTLVGIGMEEKKLVQEFGDSYIRYARKTPMLIPFTGRIS